MIYRIILAISQPFPIRFACSRARFVGGGYGKTYPYPYPPYPTRNPWGVSEPVIFPNCRGQLHQETDKSLLLLLALFIAFSLIEQRKDQKGEKLI